MSDFNISIKSTKTEAARTEATQTEATQIDLRPGQIVAVGGKLYGRCADCGKIGRMDKWLLGSLHYCEAR